MPRRTLPVLALLAVALLASAASFQANPSSKVVAHEWGTFTTVAGEDGQAINWLPLGGPVDLPCFVEHFNNRRDVKILGNLIVPAEQEGPIDYQTARSALVGTVRMETPVVYFYSPADTTVRVSVRFPRGLMTEWYPTAKVTQPQVMPSVLDNPNVVGAIEWPAVRITPGGAGSFPRGAGDSHYYAARETDAAPVVVNGQQEKFLFYRGVASFPSVLKAVLTSDGGVRVTNTGRHPIPAVILFENRGGTLSYRMGGALATSATLARPTTASSFAELRADLITMLVGTGLYRKEAEAMVETWRDSWFEEGMRVFYLVPPATVDEILPLTISPPPSATARAFVGRMEILTPDSLVRVQTALATGNDALLEREGRFLGPITDRLVARTSSVSDRNRIRAVTNTVFASYVKKAGGCN
jgi:hypothetical protein